MRDMTDSLEFWGISHIYKIGMAVFATKWGGVKNPDHGLRRNRENKLGGFLLTLHFFPIYKTI